VLPFSSAFSWTFWSPRQEVEPPHALREDGKLVIETLKGDHWIGCWQRTFPVQGGQYYTFHTQVKHRAVAHPQRCIVARVLWQDAAGKAVRRDTPAPSGYLAGTAPQAEPEYPAMQTGAESSTFSEGWTAPAAATQALVELYLQWVPEAGAEFSEISFKSGTAPQPRRVKLAAAHLQPRAGSSNAEKCAQFVPLIEEASQAKVDLLVLPETLTYYGRKSMVECAEPMPGPSTEYFGALAQKHAMHIVAGLVERDGPALYNVAVLLGPEGSILGKYRKVCLPRSEITSGIAPGHDYPVFETKLG
jgi:hypothetical protein